MKSCGNNKSSIYSKLVITRNRSYHKHIMGIMNDIAPKVETPIHDSMRELVTWDCKEHGVKP